MQINSSSTRLVDQGTHEAYASCMQDSNEMEVSIQDDHEKKERMDSTTIVNNTSSRRTI
jgi:hypothetical protein